MGTESPFPPAAPLRLMLTKVVVRLVRSRRNTFSSGIESAGIELSLVATIKLFAVLANRTYRPSELMMGNHEFPSPVVPVNEGSTFDTSCKGAPDPEKINKLIKSAARRLRFLTR